jgi:hypothetical protein
MLNGSTTLCKNLADHTKETPRQRRELHFVLILFFLKSIFVITLLHKSPDTNNVMHRLVKNTVPYHHAKHDDTHVPPTCRRRGDKQVVAIRYG